MWDYQGREKRNQLVGMAEYFFWRRQGWLFLSIFTFLRIEVGILERWRCRLLLLVAGGERVHLF
jgi:hypothetical protein